MAKQFKVEVSTEKSAVFGAAGLVVGALWTFGDVLTQEVKTAVDENVPVVKAAVRDYAEIGRAAADEAAADALLSVSRKAEELAAWFLD